MSGKDYVYQSDVLIIGGGLAGLVVAGALIGAGYKVTILERDTRDRLGGLARESFGGITLINSPQQRRFGIRDNADLALADWLRVARFGPDDHWPRRWAQLYVNQSIEMIYRWLSARSIKLMAFVNWPERGFCEPGNSLPRWHIVWGTGRRLIHAALQNIDRHPKRRNLTIHCRHKVEQLIRAGGRVIGCRGSVAGRNRQFVARADAVVVAGGGICGGDLTAVKRNWYRPWGTPPGNMLNGSHRYADGLLHEQVAALGGRLTHLDKQWHYAAGVHHFQPDRDRHGLGLVPPRSALWFNAEGRRIGPHPLVSYTDTRYLVTQILKQPGQFSWQLLNRKIALKELAVSGGAYMTAFNKPSKLRLVRDLLFGNKELVNRLIDACEDFVTADTLPQLCAKMDRLNCGVRLDHERLVAEIKKYDDEIERGMPYFNDAQLRRLMNFRTYRVDRARLCRFQKIADPGAGPLIAIREFIMTRKSMGGIQTDLDCRVLDTGEEPIAGLYAVGESAGFGGGGIHGQGSLEGTFLGSCILTGLQAAQALKEGA